MSRDELLRETSPELCLELERTPLTDDELLSEDLRPTEDLLSEDEERTELPELREEELLEEPELRLDEDDELLLEELLSEEDLRVVVVVVLPPLSLRVCASADGAVQKSAPASNAANESREMFITQIFSCPQVRSTAWRTLVNISMLSPL